MAERPEDLNLPNAVVTRIMKEALPTGINIGKDARTAISKAASVFVLYATSCANNNALKGKRKTITANDVYSALSEMEFEEFIDPIKGELEVHKQAQASKKSKKAAKSKSKETVVSEEVDATNDVNGVDPGVDEELVEGEDAESKENEVMETSYSAVQLICPDSNWMVYISVCQREENSSYIHCKYRHYDYLIFHLL
ncbi:POLE3 [Bugula neritina]|uniref:DNA polymerase epsilon subunit 3 n=1 Tax=Bugula neritina TaxID=10212 RepID=A0A7J7KHR8_BUGNE|nr:POLE3 [Bugula neritina]